MTDGQPNYHAVLVGVNWNERQPLKGAVQDVKEVRSNLTKVIHSIQPYTFTATPSTDPNSPSPLEDKKDWPTTGNVIQALTNIGRIGQPGDFVYIHFSCHGTVIDEPTGRGLGLVLFDDNKKETNLRGSLLAFFINQMVTKRMVVTLILDCCFSANIQRGEHVRYLSYDPNSLVEPRLDDKVPMAGQTSATRALRDIDIMEEFQIKHPDGYAFIVASGPDQEAKEVKYEVAGTEWHHGRFTRHLMDLLKDKDDYKRSIQEVYSRVCFEFRRNGLKQHPMLYGNERQPFFGGNMTRAAEEKYHPTYYEIHREDGGVLSIHAGHVHGIALEDQFTLYPSSRNSEPMLEPIIARVSHAGEFTSTLELIDTTLDGLKNDDWKAIIRYQSALCEFPIKLSSSVPDHEEWEAEMKQRSLKVFTDSEDHDCFLVVELEGDEFIFRDNKGHRLPNIPVLNKLHINIPEMSNLLEHLARFNIVKNLQNRNASPEFEKSFSAHLKVGGQEYDGSTPIPIGHLARAELVVRNKSPRHSLYVSIYDISPQYGVLNLYYEAFAKMCPEDGPDFPQNIRRKLTMMIPEGMLESGHTSCEDVLKVIVTSHPVWMYNLQLPKLSKFPFLKDKPSRYPSAEDVPEDWSVRNFCVQTVAPGAAAG